MSIYQTNTGNVGIGTTNPGAALHVLGTNTLGFEVQTTTTSDMIFILGNTTGASTLALYVMPVRVGTTQSFVGGIYWSGSALQYTNASDYRIKSNIALLDSQLSNLRKLLVKEFNIFESTTREVGFIAHEIQEQYPNVVTGEKDAVDENGKPKLQQVNLPGLIPYMVKGIQELDDKTAQLAAENTQLKSQLASLEARLTAAGF